MSLANQSRVSPQLARISKRPDIVEKPSRAMFNTTKKRTLNSIFLHQHGENITLGHLRYLGDGSYPAGFTQAFPQVARPAAPMKAAHFPPPFWTSKHSTEIQNASTDAALRRRTQ